MTLSAPERLKDELDNCSQDGNRSGEEFDESEDALKHHVCVTPSTRKLVRGRSEQSRLILAWAGVHVFVWLPSWGSHSLGVTVRVRRAGGWTHYRVVVLQRNAFAMGRWQRKSPERVGRFYVRRSLTLLEVSRWRTAPGTRGRTGLKGYVRLKVSPGGREA